MSSKTDDLDKAVRAVAEPFKSFPVAVATVVREMFDRGANGVLLSFERDQDGLLTLKIVADRAVFPWVEMGTSIGETDPDRFVVLMAVGLHHGVSATINADSYELHGLGTGEGVNTRQNRTAERLVRALPELLSPYEAYHTVVADEKGARRALLNGPPAASIADGFEINWPEKMVGLGGGLVLKFGAVRVPARELLRVAASNTPDRRLDILIHPWLQGVMEVSVLDSRLDIPIPTKPAEDFDEAFYADGHAAALVDALYYAHVATVVLTVIGRVIRTAVQAFAVEGELRLGNQRYVVAPGNPLATLDGGDSRGIFREDPNSGFGVHYLRVDPSHQVFRTVRPMDEEVMQVVWWQLAMWIAHHQPEVFQDESSLDALVTRIYLALRAQNLKCGPDDRE